MLRISDWQLLCQSDFVVVAFGLVTPSPVDFCLCGFSDRQLLCRSDFLLGSILTGLFTRVGSGPLDDGGGGFWRHDRQEPSSSFTAPPGFPAHLVCCLLLLFILSHQTSFLNYFSNCSPVQFPNERCRMQRQFACRSVSMNGRWLLFGQFCLATIPLSTIHFKTG